MSRLSGAPRRIVVVGASLAGVRAVETARRLGHRGPLTLIGAEEHLPYDRPPLSKEFIGGSVVTGPPHLMDQRQLIDGLGVTVRLGAAATALDVDQQVVEVDDMPVAYDALLIATGAQARTLPGTEGLGGVHTLRTLDDAAAIRAALDTGARTVVIGAGFIGSEVASAARRRGLPVTIVEAQATPLVRAVGEQAGRALAALHVRHGTDLRCGVGVAGLVGHERVEGVALTDGTVLPADLVVVGIGAAPVTAWLESSTLALDDGVVCDETLAAAPGVWAAGDVARWHHPDLGVALRLEHWTNAGDQASHAARNMLEPANATGYRHVPYFWSDWYRQRIQFAGLPDGHPQIVHGDWESDAFTALFRQGDRLTGALTLNRRGDIMKYRALISRGGSWDEARELAARRNAMTRSTPVRVA
ncbi:pyridine nucleotide-disulfide oxidoreductase [Intrasporangium chromatireducens Q5-1]|uniref:Pyridine nucleotide-disulfide oxidoreductase n=1 Tax=Intrasporangium chromatireducens Q5-1 TaxID=584657 RepID=W9GR81_9MICO|nr:FAD-dependent oxidoreductase [Intrasporangium chromatireducens]EWT06394.1 pyridine nucleotide-disulfide oxidoreductase [Intrasporangium chromatireducens Q5-1]